MLANTHIILIFCASFVRQTCGVPPTLTINLDLPPRERWREMARLYKKVLPHMMVAWEKEALKALGNGGFNQAYFQLTAETSQETKEELMGIVDEVKDPKVTYTRLRTFNSMYELNHPTFCTGLLICQPNGTVVHGRNMDYIFPFQMDGKTHQLSSVIFEAQFQRKGKPHFMAIMWPGHIGVHTGMHYGGWSVQVNQRANTWKYNLEAFKVGGKSHGVQVRTILDQVATYDDAVNAIYAMNLAAPLYAVMAGTKPYEGAVLTLDRNGVHKQSTSPIVRLSPAQRSLVQTNDDQNGIAGDIRRPLIKSILMLTKWQTVDDTYVLRQMRIPPNFNTATVFTSVFNPSTGLAKTFLPNEFATLASMGVMAANMRQKNMNGPLRGWQRFLGPDPTGHAHEGPPEGVLPDDEVIRAEILRH